MCDEQQPAKRIIDFFDPRGNTSYVETDTVGIINVTAQKGGSASSWSGCTCNPS